MPIPDDVAHEAVVLFHALDPICLLLLPIGRSVFFRSHNQRLLPRLHRSLRYRVCSQGFHMSTRDEGEPMVAEQLAAQGRGRTGSAVAGVASVVLAQLITRCS